MCRLMVHGYTTLATTRACIFVRIQYDRHWWTCDTMNKSSWKGALVSGHWSFSSSMV
ncbi:hypothetical protein PAXRUDRAFT_177619 [Paxillus rubicundulus Ve08.2h10]|uniref:Uncharacterized protein n=1 Tax=Paxillus rubicundulus Ve08.2h10 TaxID=930991 RepID=A0A0D0BQC6_9AGAM|nr:hypothetical protein PAXRUDRAFT_177619 [Paxillus rubicundulus Ve08.2h10]